MAVAASGFSTARFPDAPAYLLAARALGQTGQYPLRTDPHFFRPPGYPVFLTLVTLGRPDRIAAAKIGNAILGSLAPLLLAALSLRLFRSRAAAIGSGLVAALDPSLVLSGSEIQSEPLFVVLLLASGFLLLACVDRPSSNLGVAAGGLLGLAALTRPSALALTPLLLAPLFDRRYPLRARGHLAASAVLGAALALGPWTVRNALVYRRFIPVSDFGSFSFAIGNSEQMLRFYALRTREGYAAWARDMERFTDERAAASSSRGLLSQTLAERFADPAGTTKLLALKTWDWLRPYPNPVFWPPLVVWGVGLFSLALYAFGAIGLAQGPRRGAALFSMALLLVAMAAHVATIVAWRYRVPYWDPVLILYGTFGALRGR